MLNGAQAFELGLVNRVAVAEDFEAAVKSFATELAEAATVAIGYMKKNLNAAHHSTLTETLDREAAHMACFTTEDHKSAVQAFVEKNHRNFLEHRLLGKTKKICKISTGGWLVSFPSKPKAASSRMKKVVQR